MFSDSFFTAQDQGTQALRIVIADDHRLVLGALARTLDEDPGFDVVGVTAVSSQVLDLVGSHAPDLVLMDVHMPAPCGLTCLDAIRSAHPEVKVVLISAGADCQEIQRALRRGAAGYLVKSINPADIPGALRQVVEGTAYYAMAGGGSEAEDPGVDFARTHGLTPRELEMLVAVVGGAGNREIAGDMWVTEQTVKFHLGNVYRKLGVAGRAAAVELARRGGVLAGEVAVAA